MKTNVIGLLFLFLLPGTSCSRQDEAKKAVTKASEDFATAYFNMQYNKAATLATAGSHKWIRFKASNITQKDIEVYNTNQTVSVARAEEISFTSDSTAEVVCRVVHVLNTDSLEQNIRPDETRIYHLSLVLQDNTWLVRMAGPLRNVK